MKSNAEITSQPNTPIKQSSKSINLLALPLLSLSALLLPTISRAVDEIIPVIVEKVNLGPPPSDFGLTFDYYVDATKVLFHYHSFIHLPFIYQFSTNFSCFHYSLYNK